MDDRPPDEVMTTEEAAAYLKLSPRTLVSLRGRGEAPPGVRIGRQWRYRRSSLDYWLAERETSGRDAGE